MDIGKGLNPERNNVSYSFNQSNNFLGKGYSRGDSVSSLNPKRNLRMLMVNMSKKNKSDKTTWGNDVRGNKKWMHIKT